MSGCTGPGGVWVYRADGDLIGKLRVPEKAANLAWGGEDFRTLFMTATHSVYTVRPKSARATSPIWRARRRAQPASAARRRRGAGAEPDRAPTCSSIPRRCAMIIQDMQNDVIMDGGAFADFRRAGARKRAARRRERRRLADAARARGVIIIHVWFVVEPGAPGVTLNAPLFEGLVDTKAMVRGGWGAAPVAGLEPRAGDFVVEKMRMSAWEGTRLETILKATGRDMIINTGAWTNMSVEHTARTGADKGYFMIAPEDCCSTMNAEWHNASINFAMQNVSVVTNADAVIRTLG